MRITTLIAATAILLLTACGGLPPATPAGEVATQAEILPSSTPEQPTAAPPTLTSPAPPLAPLDLTSDIEAIRLRMLHSHETWRSLWVQFHLVVFPLEGSDQPIHLERLQVWIRQPAELLLLNGSWGDVDPDYFFVSDGTLFLDADLRAGTIQEGDVAPGILEPFLPPEELTGAIISHPLAEMIGYPAGPMIFPVGLAQRQGTYELIGEDTVAGRAALILDFTPRPAGLIFERLSLDALTGLLLRQQVLTKTADGEQMLSDLYVFPIKYDPAFPAGLFTLEVPESVRFQEAPE